MPEVTSYAPGTPSWADLATTDEKGALAFYGALFGWEDDPQPMGPDSFYHMQKLRGLYVSAMYQQMEEEKSQGVPSHWNTYITVDNADNAVARVNEAGGQVLFGPMDVFDAGRMAMVQDPQGAVFAVWQPKDYIGSQVKGEVGAIAWNELLTNSPAEAGAFYKAVLGMESAEAQGGYNLLKVGGDDVAGMLQITPEMGEVPPCWVIYFEVTDADASTSQAEGLGATVIAAPWDVPGEGRVAVLQDPQGAVFCLFQRVPGAAAV